VQTEKHYGVVYDAATLAPLRVIVLTHEDQSALLDGKTHAGTVLEGEVYCTISHEELALHLGSAPFDGTIEEFIKRGSLNLIAQAAVRKHSGQV
jgi:hypothetical protein